MGFRVSRSRYTTRHRLIPTPRTGESPGRTVSQKLLTSRSRNPGLKIERSQSLGSSLVCTPSVVRILIRGEREERSIKRRRKVEVHFSWTLVESVLVPTSLRVDPPRLLSDGGPSLESTLWQEVLLKSTEENSRSHLG